MFIRSMHFFFSKKTVTGIRLRRRGYFTGSCKKLALTYLDFNDTNR